MRALDWLREPISPPLSASSSLLLEPRAQRAESTGWTRPHARTEQGPQCKTLLWPPGPGRGSWVGLSKSCLLGSRGAALLWPRSQVPSLEINTPRVAWNSTVSKQGCRQGLWLYTGWGARKSRLGLVEGRSLQQQWAQKP